MYVHCHVYTRYLVATYCTMQGTQLSPLWCSRWMGWGVRKGHEGINIYIELVHFKVQQILTQHFKATIFQRKILIKNKQI